MKFEFFEALSRTEAQRYLENFLGTEKVGFETLAAEVSREGLSVDYTLPSLAPLFEWVAHHAKIVPKAPDPSVPSWIRETESYSRGLFDLAEESSIATMRTAFYLGETFVRQFPSLRWGIGDPETAEQNQPVVCTFKAGMEMAVILVTENLIRGMVEGKERSVVERAVQKWASFVD